MLHMCRCAGHVARTFFFADIPGSFADIPGSFADEPGSFADQ